MLIAMLCIRFTIITSMEEDYREIGVMKAIGITSKDIQKTICNKICCYFSWWVYMWIYTFTICYKDIHFEYHSLYGSGR